MNRWGVVALWVVAVLLIALAVAKVSGTHWGLTN